MKYTEDNELDYQEIEDMLEAIMASCEIIQRELRKHRENSK